LRIRAQSRALFETEALPHLTALYNFAVALAGATEAEDLVQTTCVRALEHLDSYQPGTNMRAWLFTIARNAWISQYRAARRSPLGDLYAGEPDGAGVPEPAADLETLLVDRRWSAEIKAALLGLAESYRLPVYLKDVEGFSYREIAEVTGCPLGTVMSRLSRGRASLRAALVRQARERGLLPADHDTEASDGL
jgi:RNA polymerase sigma-70 factor (ECF subfamily)